MSLAKMFEPLFARAARSYQAMVGQELKKYGLRYDDLLDPLYSTVRPGRAIARRRRRREEGTLRRESAGRVRAR